MISLLIMQRSHLAVAAHDEVIWQRGTKPHSHFAHRKLKRKKTQSEQSQAPQTAPAAADAALPPNPLQLGTGSSDWETIKNPISSAFPSPLSGSVSHPGPSSGIIAAAGLTITLKRSLGLAPALLKTFTHTSFYVHTGDDLA